MNSQELRALQEAYNTVFEARVDKKLPEHERSGARLSRYDNPSGALALGGGQQRARRAEHEERHGIIRKERLEINYVKIGALGILAIFAADWLSNKLGITGIQKAFIFIGVLITIFALMLLVSREKEGVKYI